MSAAPESHVYAVVEKGSVTNIIVATADFAATIDGTIRIDQLTPRPGVGWRYAKKVWTPPPPSALEAGQAFGL